MFDGLTSRYDQFNFFSSLGLDRRWRRALVEKIPVDSRLLDVGTGTGDIVLESVSKTRQAVGIDFSGEMINQAQKKLNGHDAARFVLGEAHRLPFEEASFDVVTSSFVLRNLYRLGVLKASFQESLRVLKKGGQVLFLDLTRPANLLLKRGHQLYLKTALPLIGKMLFGKKWPSGYLEGSVQEFPEPEEVTGLLTSVGFQGAAFQPLHFGIAGIFSATKP